MGQQQHQTSRQCGSATAPSQQQHQTDQHLKWIRRSLKSEQHRVSSNNSLHYTQCYTSPTNHGDDDSPRYADTQCVSPSVSGQSWPTMDGFLFQHSGLTGPDPLYKLTGPLRLGWLQVSLLPASAAGQLCIWPLSTGPSCRLTEAGQASFMLSTSYLPGSDDTVTSLSPQRIASLHFSRQTAGLPFSSCGLSFTQTIP